MKWPWPSFSGASRPGQSAGSRALGTWRSWVQPGLNGDADGHHAGQTSLWICANWGRAGKSLTLCPARTKRTRLCEKNGVLVPFKEAARQRKASEWNSQMKCQAKLSKACSEAALEIVDKERRDHAEAKCEQEKSKGQTPRKTARRSLEQPVPSPPFRNVNPWRCSDLSTRCNFPIQCCIACTCGISHCSKHKFATAKRSDSWNSQSWFCRNAYFKNKHISSSISSPF